MRSASSSTLSPTRAPGRGQLGADDRVVGRLGDEVVDDQRVDRVAQGRDRAHASRLEQRRRRRGLELQVDAARAAQLAALGQRRAAAAVRVVASGCSATLPSTVAGVSRVTSARRARRVSRRGTAERAAGAGAAALASARRRSSGSPVSVSSVSSVSSASTSTSWLRPLATRDTTVPSPPSRLRRAGRSSSGRRSRRCHRRRPPGRPARPAGRPARSPGDGLGATAVGTRSSRASAAGSFLACSGSPRPGRAGS